MGVLYDYFRVAGDAAAVQLMHETEGGPVAREGATVDAIDLKGIEPVVTLGRLVALAADVPWDAGLVDTGLLWSGGEEGPWLMSIEDTVRDTLASITGGERSAWLSAQWGRTEELAWDGPLPDDRMLPAIEEIAGLARRARDAGEHLYCWCCL
ncbi:hypothetical protein ACFQFC_38030 [Amorphoplanes digitatis]|uniref:DUF1877 family protein n=1 Tax=Actinoplanes digitatis TaxID=1868 RepID=A0A7W7MPQ7_9ACTN|nr:hypothetical protein [Actinoplanes digitatis]MBB4761962.1 hypothetical protein [Actinoplanes digitatis]GID91075.1 hypothetical protein Adi01nite_04870 [Actinoplanes digitatis]